MTNYEGKQHYKVQSVAEAYDAQVHDQLSLSNLRVRLFGMREESAFLAMLEHVPKGGKVLDVPVGTGRYFGHLLQHGCQTVGLDISPQMLQVARGRWGKHPGKLSLEVGDAEDLKYGDAEFDGVCCMRLLHLTPPDAQRRILHELHRVGKNWAILYFGMDNLWLRLRRFTRSCFARGRTANPFPITECQLRSHLHAVGFKIEARRWVMPLFADGMVVLVRWQ